MTPRARQDGLLVQAVGDELVVYDQERDRLHVLNPTAAAVWRLCDGRQSIAELAARLGQELDGASDEQLVWLALARLRRAHLLEGAVTPPPVANRSRRRLLRRTAGVAAGALLLPTVTSIVAPTPAAAQSEPTATSTPTSSATPTSTATPTPTATSTATSTPAPTGPTGLTGPTGPARLTG